MTDKFSESTKALEMAAIHTRTFNRQHATPDTAARKQESGHETRGLSESENRQPHRWKRALKHWFSMVSKVLVLLFFGTALYFTTQTDYLFLAELATAAAIITLLMVLQYCSKTAIPVKSTKQVVNH
jgi:hypothetical protein